jgi:hypothetical protein
MLQRASGFLAFAVRSAILAQFLSGRLLAGLDSSKNSASTAEASRTVFFMSRHSCKPWARSLIKSECCSAPGFSGFLAFAVRSAILAQFLSGRLLAGLEFEDAAKTADVLAGYRLKDDSPILLQEVNASAGLDAIAAS